MPGMKPPGIMPDDICAFYHVDISFFKNAFLFWSLIITCWDIDSTCPVKLKQRLNHTFYTMGQSMHIVDKLLLHDFKVLTSYLKNHVMIVLVAHSFIGGFYRVQKARFSRDTKRIQLYPFLLTWLRSYQNTSPIPHFHSKLEPTVTLLPCEPEKYYDCGLKIISYVVIIQFIHSFSYKNWKFLQQ